MPDLMNPGASTFRPWYASAASGIVYRRPYQGGERHARPAPIRSYHFASNRCIGRTARRLPYATASQARKVIFSVASVMPWCTTPVLAIDPTWGWGVAYAKEACDKSPRKNEPIGESNEQNPIDLFGGRGLSNRQLCIRKNR